MLVETRLEELVRSGSGRLLATAMRVVGDFDRAEEIVQEALAAALESWRVRGLPLSPIAWLLTAVKNRSIDWIRRSERERRRAPKLRARLAAESQECPQTGEADSETIPDDRLRLVFICSHPILRREGRVALTLRLVGGLSTLEIARAFLTPEPTIAQRILRAKRRIREARIPYTIPRPDELTQRLPSVLEVLYLIFNEGYAAREGDVLVRRDLCDEAIRLGELLAQLLPEQSEVHGLLALMHLQASRHNARTDSSGELLLLQEQDRGRWDVAQIGRGLECLESAKQAAGPYAIQAKIAACHATAPSWESTDWQEILRHYDVLLECVRSPVVGLNRAVAIGMLEGAAAGLSAVDRLKADRHLARYAPFAATRAEFLRQLGRRQEAAASYTRALALVQNAAERRFLERRLRQLGHADQPPSTA
jgi:RNA polymerase sigma-70 factor (ECF subfamily)